MTVMSAHFGRVAAMANGRVPFDAKAVADNVEIATYLSKLPFAGFVEGSRQGRHRGRAEDLDRDGQVPRRWRRRCRRRWPSSTASPRAATSS